MKLLTEEESKIVKVHFLHYFEGLKLRLEDYLKKDVKEVVLVAFLLDLENRSKKSKLHFMSMDVEKVFSLTKENLDLFEDYEKKYLT